MQVASSAQNAAKGAAKQAEKQAPQTAAKVRRLLCSIFQRAESNARVPTNCQRKKDAAYHVNTIRLSCCHTVHVQQPSAVVRFHGVQVEKAAEEAPKEAGNFFSGLFGSLSKAAEDMQGPAASAAEDVKEGARKAADSAQSAAKQVASKAEAAAPSKPAADADKKRGGSKANSDRRAAAIGDAIKNFESAAEGTAKEASKAVDKGAQAVAKEADKAANTGSGADKSASEAKGAKKAATASKSAASDPSMVCAMLSSTKKMHHALHSLCTCTHAFTCARISSDMIKDGFAERRGPWRRRSRGCAQVDCDLAREAKGIDAPVANVDLL